MSSFASLASTVPPPGLTVNAGLEIVLDLDKGRCLQTTRALVPGELVYQEEALVWAEFVEECETRVNEGLLLRAYGKKVMSTIDELEEELAAFESVQSLDTARSFFQLLAMVVLKDELQDKDEQLGRRIRLALELTGGAKVRECTETCRSFRELHRNVIPKAISTEECGLLLARLNTNQVELEELGGSGLFPNTAILEHNCNFNCSFTTNGSTLFLTATRHIPANSRLSLDYLNGFYMPTPQRREELLSSYGFHCNCELCEAPDCKRVFILPAGSGCGCAGGRAFASPTSPPSGLALALVCTSCGSAVNNSALAEACEERERALLLSPPTSFAELEETLQQEHLLHRDHYVFFDAQAELSLQAADSARSHRGGPQSPEAQQLFRSALSAVQACRAQMSATLPAVHHEKVIFADREGQLAVCVGETALAKRAFGEAYAHSVLCSSATSAATLAVKRLVDSTPRTIKELQAHYAT